MKTEMKNKNKTFLALVVVAALAMVSVAGIAVVSDDSSADRYSAMSILSPSSDILDGTTDADLYYYIPESGLMGLPLNAGYTTIIVPEGSTFNGTINVCTQDADGKFIVHTTLAVTGASAVKFMVAAVWTEFTGAITAVTVSNLDVDGEVLPTGDFDLTKGQAVIGSVDITSFDFIPFSGTLTSGDFSVKTEYVAGIVVTAATQDESARIGGQAIYLAPASALPEDEGAITLEGTASVGYPDILYEVFDIVYSNLPVVLEAVGELYIDYTNDGTINDNADAADVASFVTGITPIVTQFYENQYLSFTAKVNAVIEDGAEITVGVKMPSLADVTVVVDQGTITASMAFDENGQCYIPDQQEPELFCCLPVPGKYTVGISTGTEYYFGVMTLDGTADKYTVDFSANLAKGFFDSQVDGVTIEEVDGEYIIYPENNNFKFSQAFGLENNEIGSIKSNGLSITFNSEVEHVAVLGYSPLDSSIVMFGMLVLDWTQETGEFDSDFDRATPIAKDKMSATVDTIEAIGIIEVMGNLEVKGTVIVEYNSDDVRGKIDILGKDTSSFEGYVKVSGNGVIEYQVNPSAAGAPIQMYIDAAYYKESDATTLTYYYTTLANATQKSDYIILLGVHEILGEVTLDSPLDKVTVVIDTGASLLIGRELNSIYGPEAIEGTLNVPEKIKIERITPSTYAVKNGMAVFDTTNSELPAYEPSSDVVIVSETKIIYSDLAKALDIAEAGQVVELRQGATLNRDATVKTDVILDMNGNDLEIPAGTTDDPITLTVEGTFDTNGGTLTIDGELVIGGTATFDGSVILEGTIWVKSTGVLTVDGADVAGGVTRGSIEVEGEVSLINNSVVVVDALKVLGTVNVETASVFDVYVKVYIGEPNDLSTDMSSDAKFVGALNIRVNTLVVVYGESEFDVTKMTRGDNRAVINNPSTTKFMIGDAQYVIMYGVPNTNATVEYQKTDFLDVELKGWYTNMSLIGTPVDPDVMEAGLVGETNKDKGIAATYYGHFVPRMYTIILSHDAGVNWVANGIAQGTSKEFTIAYGKTLTVSADVLQGYEGTPIIKLGTSTYDGRAVKVTGDMTFSIEAGSVHIAEAKKEDGGLTLIEILLIIIIIIIAIIALVVAIKMLRS